MPSDDHSPVEITPSTILVVEPDILVRMAIADYLRDCGYKVFEGATAADVAPVLGSRQKIDVVFAEVQLSGGMDGFALAQWVREKHPDTDVILTSRIALAGPRRPGIVTRVLWKSPIIRRRSSAASTFFLLERRRTAPKG